MNRAGALDRVIEIQQPQTTQNATGEEVVVWTRFLRCAAACESVNSTFSREDFRDNRDQATRIKQFTLRRVSGVKETFRVLYEDEVYDIVGIGDIEKRGRQHFMQILAQTKV